MLLGAEDKGVQAEVIEHAGSRNVRVIPHVGVANVPDAPNAADAYAGTVQFLRGNVQRSWVIAGSIPGGNYEVEREIGRAPGSDPDGRRRICPARK